MTTDSRHRTGRCAIALRRQPFELRELGRQIELLAVRSLGLVLVTSWLSANGEGQTSSGVAIPPRGVTPS